VVCSQWGIFKESTSFWDSVLWAKLGKMVVSPHIFFNRKIIIQVWSIHFYVFVYRRRVFVLKNISIMTSFFSFISSRIKLVYNFFWKLEFSLIIWVNHVQLLTRYPTTYFIIFFRSLSQSPYNLVLVSPAP
jgi:hypothetical protein